MPGTQAVVVGREGQIFIPAETRAQRRWTPGTALVMVETPDGVLLTEPSSALEAVRRLLAGANLVHELVAGRRADAAADDEGGDWSLPQR